MRNKVIAQSVSIASIVLLAATGCSPESRNIEPQEDPALTLVAGSTVVASLVSDIVGDKAKVLSVVPNAVDAHTYEPTPSEVASIETADAVFLADRELNYAVTELVDNTASEETPVVDLNAVSLEEGDFLYIDAYTQYGKNPHTWTNPRFVWYWVDSIKNMVSELDPEHSDEYARNATELQTRINTLHNKILETVSEVPSSDRRLVVYHDAWEYFGREYAVEVTGTLQAVDYSEPSPQQLADIIERIKTNDVKVFYGSEVFPSDVLERVSEETGARYISDLSDDALPAPLGSRSYLYVELMEQNFDLILQGISNG